MREADGAAVRPRLNASRKVDKLDSSLGLQIGAQGETSPSKNKQNKLITFIQIHTD